MPRAMMGFDPGVRGGVAVLKENGSVTYVRGFKPTMLEAEFAGILGEAVSTVLSFRGWECYLEKVGHMPGDGPQGSFTFGKVYGFTRGFFKARGITIHDTPPQLWQAKMECLSGGDKNVTKRRAIALFPEIKVTHAIADALLIAEYGRQLT